MPPLPPPHTHCHTHTATESRKLTEYTRTRPWLSPPQKEKRKGVVSKGKGRIKVRKGCEKGAKRER
jgi:hypothetical protein